MAVWLSMSMSYVGPGDSANTSKIAVSVNVSWDYPHFNRDGGTLRVTVDGVTDTRTVPFNAGETSSGSQNIYSYYWNISQPNGAARTISASATFQATNATAATPASATLSLPAISGGSGGDNTGGGDSGGNEGGNTGGNEGGNEGGSGDLPNIYPSYSSNVSDVGQACIAESTSGELAYNDFSTYYFSWNDPSMNRAIIIKFLAPSFSGVSSYLSIKLSANDTLGGEDLVNYALCESDENYFMYYGATSEVDDPTQIASGTTTQYSLRDGFNIHTDQLESQTYYYLVLWFSSDIEEYVRVYLNGARYHGITFNYKPIVSGDTTVMTKEGVFYIDNGSAFDEYECFLDNGTDWVRIGSLASNFINTGEVTTDSNGIAYVNCGFVPDIITLTRGEKHPYLGENYVGNLVISLPVPAYDGFTTYSSGILRAPSIKYTETSLEIFVAGMDTEDGVGAYLYVCSIDYLTDGYDGEYVPESTTLNYTAIKYT